MTISNWVREKLINTLLKWTTNTVFSSDYKSIAEVISKVGSTQVTLVLHSSIPANTVAAAVTVPVNISIRPENPGVITKSSATSLTINSPIVGSPKHQWFSGFTSGLIITTCPEIPYTWMGTDITAINYAIDMLSDVRLNPGTVSVTASINIDQPSVKLLGSGSGETNGTTLQKSADGIAQAVYINSQQGGLEDVYVDCNSKTLDGVVVAGGNNNELRNIRVKNVGGTGVGLLINDASSNKIYNSQIVACYNAIEVRGTGSSNVVTFYSCTASTEGFAGTAYKVSSASNTVHSVWAFNLFIEPGTGKCVHIQNASASGIMGLYFEAAYQNTSDLIHITGANTVGFQIDGALIAQTHASFAQNIIAIDGDPVDTSLKNVYIQKSSNDTTPIINIDDATGVVIENLTVYCTTANNILTTTTNSVGVVATNVRATAGGASTVTLAGSGHRWYGGTSNITITIAANSTDIIIENFPGDISVGSGVSRIFFINCTGSITGAGIYLLFNFTTQGAANADSTLTFTGTDTVAKAEIVALQDEVNQIKSVLRSLGIITT